MMPRLLRTCLLFLLAVGTPAEPSILAASSDTARQTEVDYASFVERLRAGGARVEVEGEAEQPFLAITGKMIKIDGEDVQVFEYKDPAAVEAQAARISRDGATVGTTKIHWIGSPHFYKRGKLLVLYVGDDERTLAALQISVGRQFAGK